MKHLLSVIWVGQLLMFNSGVAQDFHAIQGSSYAGSLGVMNNPASIVNTPFGWDCTVLGGQLKSSTNLFTIYNYSLLSSPSNSIYYFNQGQYKRQANLNFNINLLNTRIALGRKNGIAFGINLRSYSNLSTGDYNFIDTLKNSGDFFKLNQNNNTLSGNLTSSSWIEIFGTYSRTLVDNEYGRLNAGITLKFSRGISGIYGIMRNAQFSTSTQDNAPLYTLNSANLEYGYSSNYDRVKKEYSTASNLDKLYSGSQAGASLDIGFEYLIRPQEVATFADDDNYYEYEWKIGLAFLDIGSNQYKYGLQSRSMVSVKGNTTNLSLDSKFDSTVKSIRTFNDSLATLASQISGFSGKFSVINPMRMVLNVDRYVEGAFYINGELSLNLANTFLKNYLQVTELNFITVTPRWETRKWGLYLPIQFNNQNQFWIGGAFKAGPLVLGIHNWANLFSKTKMQNGGAYVAITIRAPGSTRDKLNKKLDCPKPIW